MKNSETDFTLPPFPAFPSTNRYLSFGPVMEAVSRVQRSVLAREAISLVIGPPGTGKSLACGMLAKAFEATHDVVMVGETAIADETSFYRTVLHRLGVALENVKRGDLQLLADERLTGASACPNGTVLIIDEAASLSAEVLEAIRRMTNLMKQGQPMVSSVLAGGVRLDETLAAPSMEPFVQRVSARCYLHPLNGEETRQYIRQTIAACDACPDETISDAAVTAIHHASCGVPRLINQLMTEAIDCAAESEQVLIDESTINRAWASLQQLPGPMVDEPELAPTESTGETGSVIEFGELLEPAENGDDEVSETSLSPDPSVLFGEFDIEEPIEIGRSSVDQLPKASAEFEIETAIHSQVVSLSEFAAENTAERLAPPIERTKLLVERDPQEIAERTKERDEANRHAFPSVIWYDETDSEDDAVADAGNDDSDLLWITEDIDVERKIADHGAAHRVDPSSEVESPKLKVDYREMLEKMRNHS